MHISAFADALRTPDLRRKILFTLGLLAIYRLGSVLPTPGVDYSAIQRCIDTVQDNSVYALINLFSGGALLQLSVFALGIMPTSRRASFCNCSPWLFRDLKCSRRMDRPAKQKLRSTRVM